MSPNQRLQQLIDLVDREDTHLLAVRDRLLGGDCKVGVDRLQAITDTDIGIDRLESFGAKYGRMQDTVVDKLIPELLRTTGEQTGAAMDNLGKMERLDLIASADDWLTMRWLRNRFVHEYIDDPEALAPALEQACQFTGTMHDDYQTIKRYAVKNLGVTE